MSLIQIDPDKAALIRRQQMPRLSLVEFARLLDSYNMLEAVEDYMANRAPLLTRIAYTRADFIDRLDPTLIEVAAELGLSPEQVDSMWPSGS